ncbi:MAG TPA: hypothetical protein VFF79_13955 [Conexibacter sp.]|nr:hypothetical protein [Conexibacter sp.]
MPALPPRLAATAVAAALAACAGCSEPAPVAVGAPRLHAHVGARVQEAALARRNVQESRRRL